MTNSDKLDGLDSSQLLKSDAINTYLVGPKTVRNNHEVTAPCPDPDGQDIALSGGYIFPQSIPPTLDDVVYADGVFTNNAYTLGFSRLDDKTGSDVDLFDVFLFVTCADVDGDGPEPTG